MQRKVDLTDHFDQFIDAGIHSGRFTDSNEVIQEGLRLLEQRELEDAAKIEWLRSAAKVGFDAAERGERVEINSDDELAAFMQGAYDEATSQPVAVDRVA